MSESIRGLCVVSSLFFASCANTGPPIPEIATEINKTFESRGQAVLAPGDEIEVRFLTPPSLAEQETVNDRRLQVDFDTLVREDGYATFRVLHDLQVGGLEQKDLEDMLAARYKRLFPDWVVSARVKSRRPQTMIVMGEVTNPGEVKLDPDGTTLVEAVGLAGGHDPNSAYLESLLLVRWVPSTRSQLVWRIDASAEYWGVDEPIYVQENDIIFIPDKPIVRVDRWVDQYIRRMIPFPYLIPVQ